MSQDDLVNTASKLLNDDEAGTCSSEKSKGQDPWQLAWWPHKGILVQTQPHNSCVVLDKVNSSENPFKQEQTQDRMDCCLH